MNISKPQSDRLSETPNSSSPATRTAQTVGAGSDQVDFGSQNSLVSQALNAGTADQASRVEQLRALVQSGQYQVDSGALSKSIVDSALNGD